ncbi:MAG: hypothetical protein HY855_20340 [Burkholderiales bacterium]|nr:hypothetical protein [Burkholderiales bacterium]
MFAGTTVLGGFGAVHLLYTYRGNKLEPRDPALRAAMERTNPVITRETTMWRANKGFNASHSLGMIVLALVYGHLALAQPGALAASPFLAGLGLAMLLAYLALSCRYFFSIPLRGMALACVLYGLGWALG